VETTIKQPLTRTIGAFEKRIHEIDFFRGILILFVIVDHILNNFLMHSMTWYQITGHEFWKMMDDAMRFYWFSDARIIIRCIILGLFCFVSGVSCSFSRNNWKRAAETLVLAALIAVGSNILQATGWFGQDMKVDFNIIAVLGWSTLLYCFFQNKNDKWLIYGIVALAFFSIVIIPLLLMIPGVSNAYCPPLWEPTGAYKQSDWMPLFPYIVFFFIGALLARHIYKEKKSLFKRHEWERGICFLGRHTLIIYLSHYLVLMGIFYAIEGILRAVYHA